MENLQSQQYHSGCRSNRKTDIKSNISTNTTNWSKWSSLGICCMSLLDLTFSQFVIKPLIAVGIMGICSYFIYSSLSGIIIQNLATIIAIISAVIIYGLAIVALKVFSKDELLMLPYGDKFCKILEKLKIY